MHEIESCGHDSREEQLFLTAYSLWLADAIIGITMWKYIEPINEFGDWLRRIAFFLFVIQFLLKRSFTKKDVAGIFMIIFTTILGYHSVYNKFIIATMILIYFSANADFKKILKVTLVIQGAFMVITVFASQLDVIENVIWELENTTDTRVRESLGYDYCAYPAHLMLFFSVTWICIKEKIHILDAVILMIFNYVIYYYTNSRADFYLAVFAIVGFLIISKKRTNSRHLALKICIKYGYVFFAVFSIIAQRLYNKDNAVLYRINETLTGRLRLGYEAIRNYGFSLFGNVIRWVGMGSIQSDETLVYNYVDCAYLKDALSFGCVFFVFSIMFFYILGKKCIAAKQYWIGWAIVVSLLYAVVNAHLWMPVFNVYILAIGKAFSNRKTYK